MADEPMVAIRLVLPAGAQYEADDERGIAHLVEHLAFDFVRTPALREIFDEVQDGGGEVNAFTSAEHVTFCAEAPPQLAERALELACRCLEGASFTPERVEAERRVLLRELEVDGVTEEENDEGEDLSHEVWCRLLCDHPSTRDPAGDTAAIEAATSARLEAFFRRHYRAAEGITLVVVGDLDLEQTRRIAERTVGALPRGPAPKPPSPAPHPEPLRLTDPTRRGELLIGYCTDSALTGDYHALWFIRDALQDRLYEDVRREHQVYDLVADDLTHPDIGLIYVHVHADESDHEAIAGQIDAAFEELRAAPLDPRRWSRLQGRLINRTRRIGESVEEMAEDLVSLSELYGLDDEIPDDILRFEALTAADVQATAQRLFVAERRVEARTTPPPRASRRWLRWVAALVGLVGLIALLGAQEHCHRRHAADLTDQLEQCQRRCPER